MILNKGASASSEKRLLVVYFVRRVSEEAVIRVTRQCAEISTRLADLSAGDEVILHFTSPKTFAS
jgi:hypothetical protein